MLVVLDGSSFFVSDDRGDVEPDAEADGYFLGDTRHLSAWRLRVNGRPSRLLTSRVVDYYSARVFGTLGTAHVGHQPPVSIERDRFVSGGVHEDITVRNHSSRPVSIVVELHYGADFADVFEVRSRAAKRGRVEVETGPSRVVLRYRREAFRRGTVIRFSAPCAPGADQVRFDLRLEPRERWHTCVDIACAVGEVVHEPGHRCGAFSRPRPRMPVSLDRWHEEAPALDTDADPVRHTYRKSLNDLAALRFHPFAERKWSRPPPGCRGSWRCSAATA
jgi:glycogen debranching enzyme